MTAKSIFGILIALALTVYPGYYHGLRTFRWGQDQHVEEIAARLKAFPVEFHGWKMIADQEMSETEFDMLQPIEHISRQYARGELIVQLFLLLGPTGPTAVHIPDICFNSRDYTQIGSRRRIQLDNPGGGSSQCWESAFRSGKIDEVCVKSWYAWTLDGNWQAADNPRYAFARSPYLLKIQVEAMFPDQQSMEQSQEAEKFVKDVQAYVKNSILNPSQVP